MLIFVWMIGKWNLQIQAKVARLWQEVNTENLANLADLQGYRTDFYNLFGFNFPDIDYNADCDPEVIIPSIEERTQV